MLKYSVICQFLPAKETDGLCKCHMENKVTCLISVFSNAEVQHTDFYIKTNTDTSGILLCTSLINPKKKNSYKILTKHKSYCEVCVLRHGK